MSVRFRFEKLEKFVKPGKPGLYEIYTLEGAALKVGVGVDILARLKDHRASRASGLKLKPGGSWDNPSDVVSKKSILAKHLFFDRGIGNSYDLRTERGRRAFLKQECVVSIVYTATKEDAEIIERKRETSGEFRYVGRVVAREPAVDIQ